MHAQIHALVDGYEKEIKEMYYYLHQNGEISWEEKRTTDFICNKLKQLQIPYIRFSDQTGVMSHFGKKEKGPVVGLRTEMDALWQNVNGSWKANHSCGHDGHMTIVLFALRCLKELGVETKGMIKGIFQPAEETGGGALSLLRKGAVDDIDYLLGLHVRPIQEMRFPNCSAAIYHGASTILKGRIFGMQAHAARPHLGINVIDSLTLINGAIRSIPINPAVPSTIKMTYAQAGGKNFNIVPDYGEFGLDIRAQTNEGMQELLQKLKKAIMYAGEANGAKVEIEILAEMVAASPDAEMEKVVEESIIEMLGAANLVPPPVTPGGEDFHFYPHHKKQLKATMIGLGSDLKPGLHHPNMSFHLDSLINGIKIMVLAAVKLLEMR